MKELQPNLYGIVVPIDSEFRIFRPFKTWFVCEKEGDYWIKKEPFDFEIEILGTTSEKEITFDTSNYVESMEIGHRVFYLMYTNKKVTQCPNKSFLSLVKSKGIILKQNEKLLVIRKTEL